MHGQPFLVWASAGKGLGLMGQAGSDGGCLGGDSGSSGIGGGGGSVSWGVLS